MQSTQRHQRIYRHYKGQYYRVLYEARHTERKERLVIYQQLYKSPAGPPGFVWARPADAFYGYECVWTARVGFVVRFERVHRVPRAVARVIRKLDKRSRE